MDEMKTPMPTAEEMEAHQLEELMKNFHVKSKLKSTAVESVNAKALEKAITDGAKTVMILHPTKGYRKFNMSRLDIMNMSDVQRADKIANAIEAAK